MTSSATFSLLSSAPAPFRQVGGCRYPLSRLSKVHGLTFLLVHLDDREGKTSLSSKKSKHESGSLEQLQARQKKTLKAPCKILWDFITLTLFLEVPHHSQTNKYCPVRALESSLLFIGGEGGEGGGSIPELILHT